MSHDMPCGACCVCGEELDFSKAGICGTCGQAFCWSDCGGWGGAKHECHNCKPKACPGCGAEIPDDATCCGQCPTIDEYGPLD